MPDIFISEAPKPKEDKTVLPKPKGTASKIISAKKNIPFKKRESRRTNPLSPYNYMPSSVDFEIRTPEEKIVLLLRRHPITNIGWILVCLVMVFAPMVLNFFPIFDFLPDRYQFIVVLGWYLITLSYFLENFLGWFFNVNIITDERIIDIDFYNLIYKEVSDANIDRIQDVSYRMGGAIRTIFNYGDVIIQTASEVPNFEFLTVPKPDRVAKILQELGVEEKQEALEGRVS
jgi:membrane protein YdbS with pleckstrin-like domain